MSAGIVPFRRLEVEIDADLDAISEAVSACAVAWANAVEAQCNAVGMPAQRAVQCRVVPSAELLTLLAKGRAFRAQSDFLVQVQGAAE